MGTLLTSIPFTSFVNSLIEASREKLPFTVRCIVDFASQSTEPQLQPLNTETFHHKTANVQDGACLDISMNSFWGGHFEKCYTDIRVFNLSCSFKQRIQPSINIQEA